ncbi:MAG: ribulose-phosphate 3-epimerase [Candidatus Beckwithbacteria bacterium GW2011_GWB1_47_15]|uniref:Ribulose-phosphate 3-epimerase n=1 Tax=Candidatus Beckwithbacteria bacterium GW2011_GWB1_47_15 TaxID=1618371 RepID=A0A0G1UU34_9BACT|nr:MAG: ribulose-phosphate 3-epimerase, ribulose-phosphate 3-epimerase [Candidatus Beckwithbacteria bacterium GW2011_GWC1_49_16]KKU61220.1 MAG: ribulose-phosphate 3-epimerase [Candidatus Beckwithbacteria bacterium GW2011_GWB1_47_15]KKW03297.1 MAG: ribulose-phosphate 3-epimerase [Candidatus Beckwithbacteria bacterium GW2011_GWC2_49_11]OGD48372.1 MAG: hypothetical protein A2877_02935 [Candidatus Beckwithbacteria bacterium RIFCSPHIGHO2_01_FULL_49_39]OGD50602.1 MAG: hypothetical protein A3D86_00645
MMVKVTPTVFVKEEGVYRERLELYEAFVDRVQLDVADEEFCLAPTLSVRQLLEVPSILARDVHLMVSEPVTHLPVCAEYGAGVVTGQIEQMSDQKEFAREAERLGLKAGLAVDLETELSELNWSVAKEVEQILVMTVAAGKEEQKFNRQALEKVRQLRNKGFSGEICVDGGVNEDTVVFCVRAGADLLAVGSAIWKATDAKAAYEQLSRLATAAPGKLQ